MIEVSEDKRVLTRVVVFGAGGGVGCALVKQLYKDFPNLQAVLCGRDVTKLKSLQDLKHNGVTYEACDVRNPEELTKHATGCDAIFCTVGLPYLNDVWERDWPLVAQSLITAAEKSGAPLIFSDNLYCFGPEGKMPLMEDDHQRTTYGVKPRVRARMAEMFLNAHNEGKCRVALVRASDFFGPGVTQSIMGDTFFPAILKGGRPMLIDCDLNALHDLCYVPDLAKLLVEVAKDDSSFGKAWHVPNAPSLSLQQVTENVFLTAHGDTKKCPKPRVLKGFMLSMIRLFIPPLRSMKEMRYSVNSGDYLVDSSNAQTKFGVTATPWEESLPATIEWFRNRETEKK